MEWQPHEHALCLFESDAWHITSLPGASQHQVALLLPDAAHRPACTCDRQLRFHARTSVRACVRRPEGAYCAAGLAAAAAAASRSAGHLPASRGVPGRRPCSAATPAQPCSRRRCGSIPDGRRHRSTRRPAARPCCSRKAGRLGPCCPACSEFSCRCSGDGPTAARLHGGVADGVCADAHRNQEALRCKLINTTNTYETYEFMCTCVDARSSRASREAPPC